MFIAVFAFGEGLSYTKFAFSDFQVTEEGDGFAVTVTEDVGRFVYEEWEKDLYGESPLFEICAVKQPEAPAQEVVAQEAEEANNSDYDEDIDYEEYDRYYDDDEGGRH